MKISNNFFGLKISSIGMSIERRKLNLISENLANTGTTKAQDGKPYQRKFLVVRQDKSSFQQNLELQQGELMHMNTTEDNHFAITPQPTGTQQSDPVPVGLKATEVLDKKEGDVVYMPEHPDADQDGYVHMPNVNVVTEMVDMIAATRTYESNLQAFNNSKQMAKDAMEI